MRKTPFWSTPETLFALTCLAVGALGYVFMGSLVAEPKVLFGRALTAITPSMFPSIVLALLFILCAILVALQFRSPPDLDGPRGIVGWRRGVVFFAILTVYALLMVPIGFITSSAIATAVLSLFIGNRSIVQVALLSIFGPFLLYLSATRVLAVSLPELNAIEVAISRMLGG